MNCIWKLIKDAQKSYLRVRTQKQENVKYTLGDYRAISRLWRNAKSWRTGAIEFPPDLELDHGRGWNPGAKALCCLQEMLRQGLTQKPKARDVSCWKQDNPDHSGEAGSETNREESYSRRTTGINWSTARDRLSLRTDEKWEKVLNQPFWAL